jgi:hypothetical protein
VVDSLKRLTLTGRLEKRTLAGAFNHLSLNSHPAPFECASFEPVREGRSTTAMLEWK